MTREYMTSAEFKAILKHLGISQSEAARRLSRAPRTIRRWVSGENPIPSLCVTSIRSWVDAGRGTDPVKAKDYADALILAAERAQEQRIPVHVYRAGYSYIVGRNIREAESIALRDRPVSKVDELVVVRSG